ncbi:MAG: hypothetical protein U1F30_08950 [Steroidobacteraceae bacterium]
MAAARRSRMLMGILVLVVVGAVALKFHGPGGEPTSPANLPVLAPLPGRNAINRLTVTQNPAGSWVAEIDYFYTGEPAELELRLELTPQAGASSAGFSADGYLTDLGEATRGRHHQTVDIRHPGYDVPTINVKAVLFRRGATQEHVIATQEVDQRIDWPNTATYALAQQIAYQSKEENLKYAIGLIDNGTENELTTAKYALERLINLNPRFDAAYVELARAAMKLNWSRQGLHEAEGLLASALQINPQSMNAKILLGYVQANQRNFGKAESLFREAETASSENLWLWSNWGDMRAMQGRPDEAIAMYRKAIAHPMTHDTYDRARAYAFERALDLLKRKNDTDQLESLYKQRLAEFGARSCYSAEYAQFLLQVRGNPQAAIDISSRAINETCDALSTRDILGLAYYVKWAEDRGPTAPESLNRARVYMPASARTLYVLATGDRTLGAARRLVEQGESIDQPDNGNLTALAIALQAGDLQAARRLLALGARADVSVGPMGVPVALLPVMSQDVAGIRLMKRSGVNYSKLRFRGATALEIAKGMGDARTIEVLGETGTEL